MQMTQDKATEKKKTLQKPVAINIKTMTKAYK